MVQTDSQMKRASTKELDKDSRTFDGQDPSGYEKSYQKPTAKAG